METLAASLFCITDTEEEFHSLSAGIIIIATRTHIDIYKHSFGVRS